MPKHADLLDEPGRSMCQNLGNVEGEELVVGAAFDDFAVVEDADEGVGVVEKSIDSLGVSRYTQL